MEPIGSSAAAESTLDTDSSISGLLTSKFLRKSKFHKMSLASEPTLERAQDERERLEAVPKPDSASSDTQNSQTLSDGINSTPGSSPNPGTTLAPSETYDNGPETSMAQSPISMIRNESIVQSSHSTPPPTSPDNVIASPRSSSPKAYRKSATSDSETPAFPRRLNFLPNPGFGLWVVGNLLTDFMAYSLPR